MVPMPTRLAATACALGAIACVSARSSGPWSRRTCEEQRPAPGSDAAMVVVRAPTGEEEPQWVEPWRGILLEREEGALFVPWRGGRRLTWREEGRRLLLGGRVVACLLQGLGTSEILARLRSLGPGAPWLVLDAEALTSRVLSELARFGSLRLALLCPLERPCGLAGLERLAPALRGLSLKEAWLGTEAVRRLGTLGELWYLSLRGARLPSGFADHLVRLGRLRALDLAGVRAGNWQASLSRLAGRAEGLHWLDLSYAKQRLSRLLLEALETHGALRTLRLAATSVLGSDLEILSRLSSLRELDLSLTPLGDPATEALGELKGLRALDLRDTAIGDLGVVQLARLRRLRLLLLPRHVTDLGLRWLDRLHALEGVALGRAAVSERGPRALGGLPRLWWLELSGAAIFDGAAPAVAPEPPIRGACVPRGEHP